MSLNDLWYITTNYKEISNLIRLRGAQVDEQSQIDFALNFKCQKCPWTVNELLLLERRWNQQSSLGFQHYPSVQLYIESIHDNVERMSIHQKKLSIILDNNHPKDICVNLKLYLDGIQRIRK